MAPNDTHVALIILLTEMWGGGDYWWKKLFRAKICLCSGAFGANIRSYTKQGPRHGTPFLHPPPPPRRAIFRSPSPEARTAPRKYISLCITHNSPFFAISGCSCTAVNCMYGHSSLACNWLRCACQRMGQFIASVPTNQRPFGCGTLCTVSQRWHTLHVLCRLFVEGHCT